MAKAQTHDDEPSMEEILTSIRKIIADEGGDPAPSDTADRPPETQPPEPADIGAQAVADLDQPLTDEVVAPSLEDAIGDVSTDDDDDVLDLTEDDEVERERQREPADVDFPDTAAFDDAIEDLIGPAQRTRLEARVVDDVVPKAVPQPKPAHEEAEPLVGSTASTQTTSSLLRLNAAATPNQLVAGGDKTLEVFLAEQLREPLRVWLDENLPSLVERIVEREIKRLVRQVEETGEQNGP